VELMSNDRTKSAQSVVIIGAGIIGLAVAYHLRRHGMIVTVVDRAPEGDKASFGNAAGIAVSEIVPASVPGLMWRVPGWLLDPLGPLAVRPAHIVKLIPWLARFARAGTETEVTRIAAALSTLNGRVYDDLRPMLAATGLACELHEKGALTVYETVEGFQRDREEWALKRRHGIQTADMTGDEARALEPALGPIVQRAVFTPQWSHINDPKRLVDALRQWLLKDGVTLVTGNVENVATTSEVGPHVALSDGHKLNAAKIIIAAGAWSGNLARQLGDRVLLESERGYNSTIPHPGIDLGREVIFAEKKFVATPLTCGLRIGGAAEFGGLHAKPNFKRSEALVQLATRYLPGLRTEGGTSWSGHRPATPDSLPVIGPSPRARGIYYAFGHGHLGLTQAATTGRLVADLMHGIASGIDLSPYSISRFE
jgi:D-amino-acid dehydrogenase